uniref:C2 domain-containing protein n=1 Tax=Globisporangium ultimum (strain ATCC 200006 / CBS 805.95 / DAOM BR144) TaxID=431595 RepID=K3WV39_GLOUD
MAIASSPGTPPPSSPSKHEFGSALANPLMKIWNREPGLYVAVLRARNLQVVKKHTCNPFVVISCNNKVRLKSTRREGTMAPVWNELFDFEWKSPSVSAGLSLPVLRVVVENQLTMDQSEIVGNVEIHFAGGDTSANHAFSLRAWFPLRKIISKAALQNDHQQHQSSLSLGDIELAVSFIPPPPSSAKSDNGNGLSSKLSSTLTLKSSVLSLITRKKQQHQPVEEVLKKKKEKILSRLFHHQSPTASMVPNELSVELALNGQDFWSVAPHRCYLTPTPILVRVEPTYIAISGGTQVHVFGMNFTPTSILRVAFAFVSVASGTVAMPWSLVSHIPTIDVTRIVVVDAKYRSSTCISCVAPSLLSIATTDAKNNNTDVVVVYVSTNGLDFESIGLPHRHTTVQINGEQDVMDEERVERDITRNSIPRKRNEDVIVLENERYLVHHDRLAIVGVAPTVSSSSCSKKGGPNRGALEESKNSDHTADARSFTFPLMQHVHLYLIPIIDGVRPSDGIYTSQLTIEGHDFTQTNVATARFCAKADANDVLSDWNVHFRISRVARQ